MSKTLIIVIIAIFVISSWMLYVIISDTITPGSLPGKLNLHNGVFTGTTGEWRVDVASVTSDESLGSYMVSVLRNGSITISAVDLSDVKTSGISCNGLILSFHDVTDDNRLNVGDYFILSGTDMSSDYQIKVYWKTSGFEASGDTGRIEQ